MNKNRKFIVCHRPMKKHVAFTVSLLLCFFFKAEGQFDSTRIYFKLNIDALDKKAQKAIDSLVYNDIVNSKTTLLIVGYADYLGTEEHNKGLSERRSKSIATYLITLGIPENNIKLCIGKGEIDRSVKLPEGYASDRRVDIVIQKTAPQLKVIKSKSPAANKSNLSPAARIIADMKVGQAFRLENIYFYMGRHVVTEESYPQLDKLYEILESNPTIKIQIEGHICCLRYGFDAEDEDTHERLLSVNRAKFIYEYLASKGIDRDRMSYKGFGRSKPMVNPETTQKDQDMNRRVEIRIMAK